MKPFSDEYFNNLACMILNQKFNLNLEDRKKIIGTDRPDLYDSKKSIGIEVTQVISKEEGYCRSFFQKKFSKEDIKNKLESNKYKKFFNDKEDSISFILPASKEKPIITSIKEKLELLNSGYTIYDINGLFLYAFNFFEPNVKQAVMEYEVLKENYQYKFDIIYILTTTQLFEYKNNKLNCYNINLDLFRA